MPRLSRRERRALKNINENDEKELVGINNFKLRNIQPKTKNQEEVFQSFYNGQNLLLKGFPGTGKTFLSAYLALSDMLEGEFERVIFMRSAQPSKSVGFLPGNLKEKTKILEEPFIHIVNELFGRGDAYEYLKNRKKIEFISTSYIRGLTFDNAIVVVDECQNLERNELFATITRMGENSRIIYCGDYAQSDLKNHYDSTIKEDILKFMQVLNNMESFDIISFGADDIVRSGLCKEFIIECSKLGYL